MCAWEGARGEGGGVGIGGGGGGLRCWVRMIRESCVCEYLFAGQQFVGLFVCVSFLLLLLLFVFGGGDGGGGGVFIVLESVTLPRFLNVWMLAC